jgi:hypothetical protein
MALKSWYAALAIIVGVVGLALDFYVIAGTLVAGPLNPVARSFPNMFVYYWTFLTNLSNGALLLFYLGDVFSWPWLRWSRHPVARASMAGIITLVMGFYHIMLAPGLVTLTGPIVLSNQLLHTATPILFLVWWLVFNGHGTLRYRNVPAELAPGILYVVYILVRGPLAGEYPYTILDPTWGMPGSQPQGYVGVLAGVAVLVVLVAIFDIVLTFIDGLLGRRGKTA